MFGYSNILLVTTDFTSPIKGHSFTKNEKNSNLLMGLFRAILKCYLLTRIATHYFALAKKSLLESIETNTLTITTSRRSKCIEPEEMQNKLFVYNRHYIARSC